MSELTHILPPDLTVKSKTIFQNSSEAVSQDNLLHVSVEVLLDSLGSGQGNPSSTTPPLKFTGLYVPELQGKQCLIV